MKQVIIRHRWGLVVFVVYAALTSWLTLNHYGNYFIMIYWILGLFVGWMMFVVYRLLLLLVNSEELDRLKFFSLMFQGNKFYLLVEELLKEKFEEGSVVYSVLMYVVVVVVAIYVQFSGMTVIASGLTLGLVFHYIYQQFDYFLTNHHLQGWFWQFRFTLPQIFYPFWLVVQVLLLMMLTFLSLR